MLGSGWQGSGWWWLGGDQLWHSEAQRGGRGWCGVRPDVELAHSWWWQCSDVTDHHRHCLLGRHHQVVVRHLQHHQMDQGKSGLPSPLSHHTQQSSRPGQHFRDVFSRISAAAQLGHFLEDYQVCRDLCLALICLYWKYPSEQRTSYCHAAMLELVPVR